MLIFLFAILASVQMINGGLVPAVLDTVNKVVTGVVGPSPGAPSPGGKPYYGYGRDHYYGTGYNDYPYSYYDNSYPYDSYYNSYYPYDSYYDSYYPYSYSSSYYPYYSNGYGYSDGYGYYPNAPGGKGGKPGMGKPGGRRPGGPGGHGPGVRRPGGPGGHRPGVRRPRPAATGMEAGVQSPTTVLVPVRNHGAVHSKSQSTLLNLNL